jgi:hypothetical protein
MHPTTAHKCLNCEAPLPKNYCEVCGQPATTHRFSLKHIFSHDLIHGVLHLDKGFLYTTVQLFTRPGYAIREYIEGKRAKHFNYIAYLLLMLAVSTVIYNYSGFRLETLYSDQGTKKMVGEAELWMQQNPRLILVLLLPFYALVSSLVFRKAKQNFAEHLVMNTYRTGGETIISSIFVLATMLSKDVGTLRILYGVLAASSFVYTAIFYCQYFRKDYQNTAGLIVRSIAVPTLLYLIIGILTILVQILITHW